MAKRGKLLHDVPKCKVCGNEEVRLVENRLCGLFIVRCTRNIRHHNGQVRKTAEEAIADWRKANAPVSAA